VLYGADYCGRAADVWAAGVSLYILLTAGFPFTRPKDEGEEPQRGLQAMFLRIVTGRYAPVPQVCRQREWGRWTSAVRAAVACLCCSRTFCCSGTFDRPASCLSILPNQANQIADGT